MFTPTITKSELLHCDLLFYRPTTFFGTMIGLFEAVMNGKFDRITFSHVAIMLSDELGALKRFDAMETKKTGFRGRIGQAYVFRFDMLSPDECRKIQKYCMSRQYSKYDRKGIFSFLWTKTYEDEFKDYCSELIKNALVYAGKMQDMEKVRPFELYKILRPSMHFHGIII